VPLQQDLSAEESSQGRCFLIAAGIAKYARMPKKDQLPSVDRDISLIVNLFTNKFKYDYVLPHLSVSPTCQVFRESLSEWLTDKERKPTDIIVFYYSGHGYTHQTGTHYLYASDTDPDNIVGTALRTSDLGDMLADSNVRQVLVLLDTCSAGQGIHDFAAVASKILSILNRNEPVRAGFYGIAAARPKDEAQEGAFAPVFVKVVEEPERSVPGVHQKYLSPLVIVPPINDEFVRRDLSQRAMGDSTGVGTDPLFIPNLGYHPSLRVLTKVDSQLLWQINEVTQTLATWGHQQQALYRAVRGIEDLLPLVLKYIRKGHKGAGTYKPAVDYLIDQVLEKSKEYDSLLVKRAELSLHQGHWKKAFADLQQYFNSARVYDPHALSLAGDLLIILGNWTQGRIFLRSAQSVADKQEQIFAQARRLWIADYQGYHFYVVEEGRKLLRRARKFAPSLIGDIEHRIGRAMFDAALDTNNPQLMKSSLKVLKHAKAITELVQGFTNPFHDLWIYCVSDKLQIEDDNASWKEAQERVKDFSDASVVLHLNFLEADRATRDKEKDLYKAEELLTGTLLSWTDLGYKKGVFDVSYSLGEVLRERDRTSRIDALMYFRLASRMGDYLQLPSRNKVRREFNKLVQQFPNSSRSLVTEVDKRIAESEFSNLIVPWSFSVPAL
jgi:tetratricopeptide (TPR) repeat protein